jgi:hypothetical protein
MPSDAIATMGTLLPTDAEGRDAVHVAVVVMQATTVLFPGQHLDRNGSTLGTPVGIVDPFLTTRVMPGDRFWLFLYPRTITSLRHAWSHPAFEEEGAVTRPPVEAAPQQYVATAASEQWLRDYAYETGIQYETLLSAAEGFLDEGTEGEYLHIGGEDASGEIHPAFWLHVARVLGRTLPGYPMAQYFTCSC